MQWPYPWNKNTNPLAIPSGFLRSCIQIQSPSPTKDSTGGKSALTQWNQLWSGLAGIMTASSKEVFQSGFTGQVTHRVTIHFPGNIGVAPGCRVVFGGRNFIIQAIDNVEERNRVLHLLCLEVSGPSNV